MSRNLGADLSYFELAPQLASARLNEVSEKHEPFDYWTFMDPRLDPSDSHRSAN